MPTLPSARLLPLAIVALAAAGCVAREEARDTTRASSTPADTMTVAAPPTGAPAGPSADSAPSRDGATWVVTFQGAGPVRAGMSLAQLSTALGEPARATYDAGSRCAYLRSTALPKQVGVMIVNDTVARVDIREAGVRTAAGAAVGDTEAEVQRRYPGQVRTTPHKYTGPTGHYLTVSSPADASHLIVFETDGQRVTKFRSGRRPEVEAVEGCS